jgi:GH24 family phage-related lysozyme (muramidase)
MNIDTAIKLAVSLVAGAEGFRDAAWLDTMANPPVWTVGHGTTWINGRPVRSGVRCTREQADAWCAADLDVLAGQVSRLVKVSVSEPQCAALISLAYNIGIGHFERSTVLEALNLAMYQRAADRFLEYDDAGGLAIAGLETRRARERALFLSGLSHGVMATAGSRAALRAPAVESEADKLNDAEINQLRNTSDEH